MYGSRFFCSLLLFITVLVPMAAEARPHPGVEYVKLVAAGVPIHLVDVDLRRNDLVLRAVVAPSGQRYTMGQFVKAHHPLAAVNGTFFDTISGVTVGNLVSNGRLLSEGIAGSNLIFRKNGDVELTSSNRNLGRYQDWTDATFAVGGGPTLLADGEYVVDPKAEGFTDPSLFRPRPRTALGVTADGKLRMVVVTQGVTFWTLAHIMKDLGCVHALNLDGGSSSGLSVGGKTMVAPSRKLTNLIGIFTVARDADMGRAVGVAGVRAIEHFQKGTYYLQRGENLQARSQMRQAVAKAPSQALYWRAAGRAEGLMNNYPRAVQDFLRSAELYMAQGDLTSTVEVTDLILGLDDEHPLAHLLCGEAMIEQGLEEEAVPHLEAVLLALPGHERATELLDGIRYRARSKEAFQSSQDGLRDVWRALGLNLPLSDAAVGS